jgi:hypothetical protein
MKKLTFILVVLMISFATFAQVKISTSGGNPDASAGLEVDFNNKGFLPPRMTTAQRNAIASPADGLIIFNTTTGCPNYRHDGNWYEWCGIFIGEITTLNCISAINNGTLASSVSATNVSSQISYTGGNGGSHNGQTVVSTGVTGLTAKLDAGTFALGSGTLTYTITGTPNGSGTASFALNIGGQTCILNRIVTFTCGNTVTFTYKGGTVTYGTVSRNYVSIGTKCWLDRNLGATRVATSVADNQAYGDLFQWGRGDDGHQNTNSSTINTLSNNDQPGNGSFILVNNGTNDWRDPQNNNLWQGVNGINNPCPSGWRLPTETELEAERNTWGPLTGTGAFSSPLKFTYGSVRLNDTGGFFAPNNYGGYWSSTLSGSSARALVFDGSISQRQNGARALGRSVRCIND